MLARSARRTYHSALARLCAAGQVFALDEGSGAHTWSTAISGTIGSPSPAVANGVLFIRSDTSTAEKVQALNAPSGAQLCTAVDFARRALEVAGDDPGCLANAAFALAYFGEDIGAMMALVDRALLLNPSFARGWALSANVRVWAGRHYTAIQHVEAALRLSPRARRLVALRTRRAHFFCLRFDEAMAKLALAIQEDSSHPPSYWYRVACYAHMGRFNEAREIVKQLRALTLVSPDASFMRSPEDRELLLSGLRRAMGETI